MKLLLQRIVDRFGLFYTIDFHFHSFGFFLSKIGYLHHNAQFKGNAQMWVDEIFAIGFLHSLEKSLHTWILCHTTI